MKKKIIIIGAGGHGWSVAETILIMDKFNLVGFIDDKYPEKILIKDVPIIGNTKQNFVDFLKHADHAIVAIGNNELREILYQKLKIANFTPVTIIHPAAIVSPSAQIGQSSVIMAGAIVGSNSIIGNGVIVNSGAIIDHDCILDDFSHMAVGTCIGGGSRLLKKAWLLPGQALGYTQILSEIHTAKST